MCGWTWSRRLRLRQVKEQEEATAFVCAAGLGH